MQSPPFPLPAKAPSPVAMAHSHLRRESGPRLASPAACNPDGHASVTQDDAVFTSDRQHVDANTAAKQENHHHLHTPSTALSTGNGDTDTGPGVPENRESNSQSLDESRRQTEENLVREQTQQQQQLKLSSPGQKCLPPEADTVSPKLSVKESRVSPPSSPPGLPASASSPSASYADSIGSSNTVTAGAPRQTPDQSVAQTSSYPFPTVSPRTPSRTAQNPARSQESFKLTFPEERPMSRPVKPSESTETRSPFARSTAPRSIFLPPGATSVPEDPRYPTPNLYDLTLRLNADPGLDAWWANVVHILQAHYGAERATLAVPGDSTDLENVPWGQKATFNVNFRNEPDDAEVYRECQSVTSAPKEDGCLDKRREDIGVSPRTKTAESISPAKRPPLLSRHSFAGFGKDGRHTVSRELHRPQLHSRAKSILGREEIQGKASDLKPVIGGAQLDSGSAPDSQKGDSSSKPTAFLSSAPRRNSPLAVFPVPRALEVEADPLIKRTGVVKLFGRTEPAVITRQYAHNPATSQPDMGAASQTSDDKSQITPVSEAPREAVKTSTRSKRSSSTSDLDPHVSLQSAKDSHPLPRGSASFLLARDDIPVRRGLSAELYEEYEQTPPSPWSQSPAPSPAPRSHPEQDPFFTNHSVDEEAFAKNPPAHEYSKVQPVEAIGIDRAESVVHIPLLHATSSKEASSKTLRFPVAIISFLSPIVPFPSNLRQSLTYLTPHLTNSFCLAQQYSQLEKQVAQGAQNPRYGHLLGLGGTFSDASSELELVAGLSGHVNYALTDDGSLSARAGLSSPDDGSGTMMFGPALSRSGRTPGLAPRRSSDALDGNCKLENRTRVHNGVQNVLSSTPTSPGKDKGEEETTTQDPGLVATSSTSQEGRRAPGPLPMQASSRNASTNIIAQLHRELPRPFPDTIAQLMLNSIPLHLFLAKPFTGEVIWTNAKFDAYRRSQPQERRVRDPWQNIHPSERDHISKEWAKALRTGSQFTERVRVKRFNDESAYRWFIFRANPLISATGELLYWIGSFLDVHEQHMAEMKAAQERERFATDAKYRALANSIPQVVFEAAEYRGLISANEQWYLYTGQKIEDAMNFGFTKYIHKEDLEKCSFLVDPDGGSETSTTDSGTSSEKNGVSDGKSNGSGQRVPRGVTPALEDLVRRGVVSMQKDENGRVFYSTEIRLRSRGGDFRWHLVRLVKVETSSFGNGEASWYGTCTDIHDRKLLERELNKAMQQLNKEMESKTKFFSNMSHEIRTPLNGILGTIPFLLDTPLDNDQRRMLDTIQNSSLNLRELVDNILDVSRVEAGKMSLVNTWFHVRSVIEDVIDTIASRAIDKGLEINYLMDPDVPSMVIGDRFRIRQVLINLVGNAVKFTTRGEIYTRCSIYHDPSVPLKPTEILLHFEVVDTGKGFSAADAERLMERFSQIGGSGSQQHAGSGLGLFLSKQLVEMHGGKLTPSSKEGQGAKFSFYVKVDAPPPPPSEEPPLSHQSSDLSEAPTTVSNSSPKQGLPRVSEDSTNSKISGTNDLSPSRESPAIDSSSSSDPPVSSAVPTPEPQTHDTSRGALTLSGSAVQERSSSETSSSDDTVRPSPPSAPSNWTEPQALTNKKATIDMPSDSPHSSGYSVLILCPLDNARAAIKQHIEQVIPHEVPSTVTALPDVEEWKDLINFGDCPALTHLVLNLHAVDDILEVMQYVLDSDDEVIPTLVIISDLYQKRQLNSKIEELEAAGRKVHTVPKPVKPSAFSNIFDPENRRDLSKDRNRDMVREVNNNFKTMSKIVKEVIGNKGYRILLVEDDETNRMVCPVLHSSDAGIESQHGSQVMLKYLEKIKVIFETAGNGQECTELVFSKEPGYYSLIIVRSPVVSAIPLETDSSNYSATSKCPSRMGMIPVVRSVHGSRRTISLRYRSWLSPPTP